MSFELRKRKSWSDEGGVSEVIGNILILMITVVLFSGIIAFVNQMPVPEQIVKADFTASITFTGDYSAADLKVTHIGGEVLESTQVSVIVQLDDYHFKYDLADDAGFTSDKWSTGGQWNQHIDGTTQTSLVYVTIYHETRHEAIWSSQVSGGSGGNPPTVLQRYTDSNPTTSTPDPVKQGDNFTLFVKIVDLDNDLDDSTSSVYVDASAIGGSGYSHYAYTDYFEGWFLWEFNELVDDANAVDGKLMIIYASDLAGHSTVTSHALEVTILPIEPQYNYYPQYVDIGVSGLPLYLSYISIDSQQGFGVYGEKFLNGSETGEANTDDARITFWKDEMVFIRFASIVMTNVLGQNDVILIDTRTGLNYTPEYVSSSTYIDPFYPYPTGGGAYVYECKFNTSGLAPGAYTAAILLANQPPSGGEVLRASPDITLLILDEGSPISSIFIPTLVLYKDSSYTTQWGDKDNPFSVTSSGEYMVYVTMKVIDAQITPPHPNMADLRIKDMAGNSMLYGSAPAGAMISKVWKWNTTYYNFSMNLRLNNGDQWASSTNAYTLSISKFNDTNEGLYSVTKQLFVTGAGARADFFVGTGGMAAGNNNFNTREYLYYVQNNNFFTSKLLSWSDSTPSASTDYACTALAVGDLDGDGDKDALMGQKNSNALTMFENTLNSYGIWQSGSVINRPDTASYPIIWIAFGDVTGDGHDDFAYAATDNRIVIYNTTYGSRGWIYYPPTGKGWDTPVRKIALEDMNNDGRADLVVLGGYRTYIYDLRYAYDSSLTLVRTTEGTERFYYFPQTAGSGTVADIDIEDMNGDGYMDVLTTGTNTQMQGINVNYYTAQTGTRLDIDTNGGYDPLMVYGNSTPENILSSTTSSVDGTYVRLNEQISGGDAGKMSAIFRFTGLPDVPDQTLRVVAKTYSPNGTPNEVFYVWYSLDGASFVPVLSISNTTMKYYNFSLPQNVMGADYLYVKFTDSLTSSTSAALQDCLDIDLLAIYTGTFQGYTKKTVDTDATFTGVRAGNIDNTPTVGTSYYYREVVVAKDAQWKVYICTSSTPTWAAMPARTSISHETSFHPHAHADVNEYDNVAITMFDVVDINGDGYDDILTCNYTVTGSGISITSTSWAGFYMNLYTGDGYQSWRYFLVRTWIVIGSGGQNMSPPLIDNLMAAKLTVLH